MCSCYSCSWSIYTLLHHVSFHSFENEIDEELVKLSIHVFTCPTAVTIRIVFCPKFLFFAECILSGIRRISVYRVWYVIELGNNPKLGWAVVFVGFRRKWSQENSSLSFWQKQLDEHRHVGHNLAAMNGAVMAAFLCRVLTNGNSANIFLFSFS